MGEGRGAAHGPVQFVSTPREKHQGGGNVHSRAQGTGARLWQETPHDTRHHCSTGSWARTPRKGSSRAVKGLARNLPATDTHGRYVSIRKIRKYAYRTPCVSVFVPLWRSDQSSCAVVVSTYRTPKAHSMQSEQSCTKRASSWTR